MRHHRGALSKLVSSPASIAHEPRRKPSLVVPDSRPAPKELVYQLTDLWAAVAPGTAHQQAREPVTRPAPLLDELDECLTAHQQAMVLDLNGNARLAVVTAHKAVLKPLHITDLGQILRLCPSVSEALLAGCVDPAERQRLRRTVDLLPHGPTRPLLLYSPVLGQFLDDDQAATAIIVNP